MRRLIYRFGMLEAATKTSDLETIVPEPEALNRDLRVAILDNRLLEMGGTYGDLDVGTPIQYDELVIEHGEGKTVIRVFNRAILFFTSRDDVYVRVHRVCSLVERARRA